MLSAELDLNGLKLSENWDEKPLEISEDLLKENSKRFVMFPIQFQNICACL